MHVHELRIGLLGLALGLIVGSVTFGFAQSDAFQAKVLTRVVPDGVDLADIPRFANARAVFNRVEVPRRRAALEREHAAASEEPESVPCEEVKEAAPSEPKKKLNNHCYEYREGTARWTTCKRMEELGWSY
jgi:hypothetical protein